MSVASSSLARSLPWQEKNLDSHAALTSSVTSGQSLRHPQFWCLASKTGTRSQLAGLSSRLNETTDPTIVKCPARCWHLILAGSRLLLRGSQLYGLWEVDSSLPRVFPEPPSLNDHTQPFPHPRITPSSPHHSNPPSMSSPLITQCHHNKFNEKEKPCPAPITAAQPESPTVP